jgi:3-hydroxyisobutyrate dehydrogenase
MQPVAVLGLGIMGGGIARNLLKAGFPLTVYNRTKDKAAELLAQGAAWADSPRAAAARAEAVISVIADDDASRAMWLGAAGAFAGMKPGALGIECATVSHAWALELHAQAKARGVRFMDAPLAGSKLAAASGALTLFIGAEAETLEAARPVLQAFTNNLIHFGPPGSGALYKLINNMMGAAHLAALSEGIALAEKGGLNMETVARAVGLGAISSPIVKGKLDNILRRDYADAHFATRWMHKDLTYALRAGDAFGASLPTIKGVRELFALALQKGLGDLDWSAEAEVVRGQ